MKSWEIRRQYLDYFIKNGHKEIPSSSLIPYGDATLLLTTAGMVQFKPYFLGEGTPPAARMTSCQKCFRTTDIDSVGDASHLTFFEMLGNFSIGNYFKKEAITYAWDFITNVMSIPQEKLWITVYLDDEEAIEYWQVLGVPASRIVRCGAKDNFWGPAGDSGPCGPCSEIHYDYGIDKGCGLPSCSPSCSCHRFCEIWNLVFIQYDQLKNGTRLPLKAPSIDTGMGLERITAVMQGKDTVYDTDIFSDVIDLVCQITGKKYHQNEKDDINIRIMAEHGRSVTFLVTDGVLPSNEGRGYVLKRMLRRAALVDTHFGLKKPFLGEIIDLIIKKMGNVYTELKERASFVKEVIRKEEEKFAETLTIGLELLSNIMQNSAVDKIINGQDAFKLYDTYGFPAELTAEIAAEKGFVLDYDGFKKEMEVQKQKSKKSSKFQNSDLALKSTLGQHKTTFTGYYNFGQEQAIALVLTDGQEKLQALGEGQNGAIILDKTPFYGEMGGQVGDSGYIISKTGKFYVHAARHLGDSVLHEGEVLEGSITCSDTVTVEIDKELRYATQRNHTATHLLHSALHKILGEHVQQRGSVVDPYRLRFDFSHLSALTAKEIAKINALVNEYIMSATPISAEEMSYSEAIATGATALFGEKYGEKVRVVQASDISAEFCGGCHVQNTGQVGLFNIVSESSVASGVRRIEAVTGFNTLAYHDEQEKNLKQELEKTKELLNEKEKEFKKFIGNTAQNQAQDLASQAKEINGIKAVITQVDDYEIEVLREMADTIKVALENGVVFLASIHDSKPLFVATVSDNLIQNKGLKAGDLVKAAAIASGGGGGGRAQMATGGGLDATKLPQILEAVIAALK